MLNPLDLPTLRDAAASFDPPLSLWPLLDYQGGLELAVGFGRLFWPEFVERDGHIFLAERFSEGAYSSWVQQTTLRVEDREEVMNHVHLWDLFSFHEDQRHDQAYLDLGRVLQQTWAAALVTAFPDRRFHVEFADNADGEDYGPTLTFWQHS